MGKKVMPVYRRVFRNSFLKKDISESSQKTFSHGAKGSKDRKLGKGFLERFFFGMIFAACLCVGLPFFSGAFENVDVLFEAKGSGEEALKAPAGVAFDDNGRLYVTDKGNCVVRVYSQDGKLILTWGGKGKGDGQFLEPFGIAIHEDLVFVTDPKLDKVQVFDLNGKFLYWFGGSGSAPGRLKDPHGLVVSGQGRVYVAETSGKRVSVFTTQGLYLDSIIGEDGKVELSSPVYLAMDRSGNLYVADIRSNSILIFSDEGKFVKSIASKPLGVSGVGGVAVTQWGHILIGDSAGKIFLLDREGNNPSAFGSGGSGRGQFNGISSLSFAEDGRLAVADSLNNRVQVLLPRFPESSAVLPPAKTLPRLVIDNPLSTPSPPAGIAVGENGVVFVFDSQKSELLAFTRRGNLKFSVKTEVGSGECRIAVGNGRVYVSSTQTDSIYVFKQENGEFLFKFGGKGKATGQFNSPRGMGVGEKLFVADSGNNRVQVFSPDGVYLRMLGNEGVGLKNPSDVTLGLNGMIYVADNGNGRIVRFKPNMQLDSVIGEKGAFKDIVGIRVDEDGRIFVLEGGGQEQIKMLSKDGKFIMKFGSRGTGGANFLQPSGMDYSVSTIFVADAGNKRVLKIKVMDVPEEPTGVAITFDGRESILSWRKGRESFLKGYRVYAVDELGKKIPLGETEETKYAVPYSGEEEHTRFTITAFSRDGLESTPAPALTDWGRIGWTLISAGKTEEAVSAFENALKANPQDPFALKQLGMAYLAMRKFESAREQFEKLLENKSYAGDASTGLGIIAFEEGNFEVAEKLFMRSLSYNSQNAVAQRYLAEIYNYRRDWLKSLDYAKEASSLEPTNARLYELMGLAYFHLKLFGKSAKSLSMAISLTPENAELYVELARVYKESGQLQSAEDMFLKAVEVSKGAENPILELGAFYLETNRLDLAEEMVEKVVAKNPNSADAYRLKGKICLARGRAEDAIEVLQKALSLDPQNPDVKVSLASSYLELGRLDEAAAVMEKARNEHPENETVLLASAKVREAQGDWDGALEDLVSVVKANPSSAQAFLAKGKLHMKRKEYQSAAECFKKLSQLLPGSTEPLFMLAEAQSLAGRFVEAEEALLNAVNLDVENAKAHYALGMLYVSKTDYAKAIPELKLAAYLESDNAQYHYALGKAYYDSSELEEAVESLRRASELRPSDENIKRDLNLAVEALKKYRSSGNVPPVEISRVEIKPFFLSVAKSYQDNPIGKIILKNNGKETIYKLKISFKIKKFMEQPSVMWVDALKPGAPLEIPLTLSLGQRSFNIVEDSPVLGIITVEYTSKKTPQKLSTTVPFTIYSPNALVWSDKAMTGAFITPQDWPITEFARGALELAGKAPESLPYSFFRASAVYETLMAHKISYLEDPNRPYRQSSKEIERVDYVQYPRDTLRLRSGDCDDLTILYISLLENIGVETAIADLPGHVLALVELDISPDEIPNFVSDSWMLIEAGGKVWIPVEMTAIGVGFTEAWTQGATQCRKAKEDGKFSIIFTHESWKKYAPAVLPITKWTPVLPPAEVVASAVERQMTLIMRRRLDIIASELKERLDANPADNEARIELGVLYAENGDLEKAKEEFLKVLELDPQNVWALNNLGNVFFLEKNFQTALEKYKLAEALAPTDAEILMNLAMTYYQLGNLEMAREKFESAVEADPDIGVENEDFKELLQ